MTELKQNKIDFKEAYIKWHYRGAVAMGPAPDYKKFGLTFMEAIEIRDELIKRNLLAAKRD